MTLIQGKDIDLIRSIYIAQGLEMWAAHKMQLTRIATPKFLMQEARKLLPAELTKNIGARGYLQMALLLRRHCEIQKPLVQAERGITR